MAPQANTKAKIGVLGASGYTGSELVRLLLRHPHAEIALLTADRRAGQADGGGVSAVLAVRAADAAIDRRHRLGRRRLDLAFCALPHGTTQKVIKDLLARAPKTQVVDLSADFRLAPEAYANWYGHAHHAPELQKEAVYGLTEVYRDEVAKARLVANPGCYTTCAQLPLFHCCGPRRSIRTRSSSTPNPA